MLCMGIFYSGMPIKAMDAFIFLTILITLCAYLWSLWISKKYRRWWIYKKLMGERAKPAYTDEEIKAMEQQEKEKAEELEQVNSLRHKERVRQNAQRFSGGGSTAAPGEQKSQELQEPEKTD